MLDLTYLAETETETETSLSRPRLRPRPDFQDHIQGRDWDRDLTLEAEAETRNCMHYLADVNATTLLSCILGICVLYVNYSQPVVTVHRM